MAGIVKPTRRLSLVLSSPSLCRNHRILLCVATSVLLLNSVTQVPHNSKGLWHLSNLFLPFRISKEGGSVYGQDVEKSNVHLLAASCLHDGW